MRFVTALGVIATGLILSSCVESRQVYYLNADGSGKMRAQAKFSQMQLEMEQKDTEQKAEAPTHEDSVEMYKCVRQLIKRAEGIAAWDSLQYGLTKQGQTRFQGVAYFPDVEEVLFKKLPILPVQEFSDEKLVWGVEPEPVDTAKPRAYRDSPLSREAVNERVQQIQRQYKQRSQMIEMVASLFELTAVYHLPYKIKDVKGVEQIDKRTVKVSLDIEAMMEKVGQLMDDEAKLRDLVAKKGVNGFDLDNKHLLKAAFQQAGFKKVTFRTGLFSGQPQNAFNYEETVQAIQPKQPSIPSSAEE